MVSTFYSVLLSLYEHWRYGIFNPSAEQTVDTVLNMRNFDMGKAEGTRSQEEIAFHGKYAFSVSQIDLMATRTILLLS